MTAARSWWEALRADPVAWLLDEAAANVVWRVLVELFERPQDSLAVRRARSGANVCEPVATLLEPLLPDGTWDRMRMAQDHPAPRERFVIAVQSGADPEDPRLHAAAERFLDSDFRDHEPCSVARGLQAFRTLGWGHDLRFEERLAWLMEEAPRSPGGGWACHDRDHGGGPNGCAVTAAALLGTAGREVDGRFGAVRQRASGVLIGELDVQSRTRDGRWGRAGHPNLDRTDRVEVLWALARAGIPYDPRMREALAQLQADQNAEGRWTLEIEPPSGGAGERCGQPSRWITLHALVALKAYAVPAGLPRLYPGAVPAGEPA